MSELIPNATRLARIKNSKFLYRINNEKYVVWQANKWQIPLLVKLGDCKVFDNSWIAQLWYENIQTVEIDQISADILLNIHTVVDDLIDGSWLLPIDDMWANLSSKHKKAFVITWEEYKLKIQHVTPSKGVIIHGDIHPGNVVLFRDQIYLIDWEWCSIGPAEYDLAMLKQYMSAKSFDKLVCDYSDQKAISVELIDIYYNLCLFRCAVWALSKTDAPCPPRSQFSIEDYRNLLKVGNQEINYSDLASAALSKFGVNN